MSLASWGWARIPPTVSTLGLTKSSDDLGSKGLFRSSIFLPARLLVLLYVSSRAEVEMEICNHFYQSKNLRLSPRIFSRKHSPVTSCVSSVLLLNIPKLSMASKNHHRHQGDGTPMKMVIFEVIKSLGMLNTKTELTWLVGPRMFPCLLSVSLSLLNSNPGGREDGGARYFELFPLLFPQVNSLCSSYAITCRRVKKKAGMIAIIYTKSHFGGLQGGENLRRPSV